MQEAATQTRPVGIQFCQQNLLCDKLPFSNDQLSRIIAMIYTERSGFTGYLNFVDADGAHYYIFFFKGNLYAAGRYTEGKPTVYTIQDLARQLIKTDTSALTVTLCETDPILLKSMLLFLQKEPAIKAPTSLIDFEYIVQQIGESGRHAMIALRRENSYNCFFFKDGACTHVHYADPLFKRPHGMSLEEEMLLYAFQPGDEIQAYIYRDMNTVVAEDSDQYDKDLLHELLTVGYLKNKRKGDQQPSPTEADGTGATAAASADQAPEPPHITLNVESGPLAGANFTVSLPCLIGRKDCDLILDDPTISRRHAELKAAHNSIIIEDLNSKNGIRVNGAPVTSVQLMPNDLISLGPINLRIMP